MARLVRTLSFSGELDTARRPEIVERFNNFRDGGYVIVDLTLARQVHSTFLGELLLFNRRISKSGDVVVIIANSDVAFQLVYAGLDKRVRIVRDLSAALAAIELRPVKVSESG